MLQTSARLLRLLSLFQARRYWSGAELSQELEVTDRTLRRDVDRLRSLGYPVHSTSCGNREIPRLSAKRDLQTVNNWGDHITHPALGEKFTV